MRVNKITLTKYLHASMKTLQDWRGELELLKSQKAAITSQGDVIENAHIDKSRPGGTARGKVSVQYRLRFNDGRKMHCLKPKEVAEAKAAVKRGRDVTKLNRAIAKAQSRIDAIAQQAIELGLVIPD